MNDVDVPWTIVVDFLHAPFHAVTVCVPVTARQTTFVPLATLTAWGFHRKPDRVLTPLIATAASAGWAATPPTRTVVNASANRFRRMNSSLAVVVRGTTSGEDIRFIP